MKGNFRKDKPDYLSRLCKVKPLLPRYYAVRVREKNQKLHKSKVHNAVMGRIVDWEVLEALELLVGIKSNHK